MVGILAIHRTYFSLSLACYNVQMGRSVAHLQSIICRACHNFPHEVRCNDLTHRSRAPGAVRIGLETGPTATWLWTALKQLGLPVICIDARHAKAVLKMQINKSDRNDAAGIARIMQTGWFKEVRVKDLDSHSVRALLASRALLVKIKRDLENQIRGLLKNSVS